MTGAADLVRELAEREVAMRETVERMLADLPTEGYIPVAYVRRQLREALALGKVS